MGVARNSKGKWRVVGRKVVKIGKLCKKPAFKLLKKAFVSISRMFSAPVQHNKDDEQAFMFCILQASTEKSGWETSVLAVLKQCKGVGFQMDGDGRAEVRGIGHPSKLLKRIAKSSKVKLQWFQFSQCSANLFPPQPSTSTKKEEKQPTLQQHNNNNPLRGGYGFAPPHPRIFR